MSHAVPLGEIVDPNLPLKPAPDPVVVEEVDAGWFSSSFDLLMGVEVTESGPGEFEEALLAQQARTAGQLSVREWVLQFVLKRLDRNPNADTKELIALARELWKTRGDSDPGDVANE